MFWVSQLEGRYLPVNFAGEVFLIRADSGMRGVRFPEGCRLPEGWGSVARE